MQNDAHLSVLTRQRIRSAWMFLIPMILILTSVVAWPLLRTIYFSFTDASLDDLASTKWVGFTNFVYLFSDPDWWHAVYNTLVFTFLSVSIETILGIIIALTLNAHMPGRGLLRTAVMIPWAVPTIVSAQMWGWMFHDQYGVINDVLLKLHLINEAKAWTADPHLALFAIVLADVWKTTPFMALLILASLQLLPQECYESARVDGIHPIKVFFKVTLPLIKPGLMIAIIFRCLDAMRIFDLIYILTSNSRDTISMSVYARQQLVDFQDVGYGSAASTTLFMIIALLTIILLKLCKVNPGKEAA